MWAGEITIGEIISLAMFLIGLFLAVFYFVRAWQLGGYEEKMHTQIERDRNAAHELMARAKVLAHLANVEQDHAVCQSCERITTRYRRDDNGITCVNCAVDHAELG